jgi:hypothetical protein
LAAVLDRLSASFDRCSPGQEAQLPFVTLTLTGGASLSGHVLAADPDTVTLARTDRAGDWRDQLTAVATATILAITAPSSVWMPVTSVALPPSNLEWKRAGAAFEARFGCELRAEPASHAFLMAVTAAMTELTGQDAEASALLQQHVQVIALRAGGKISAGLAEGVLTLEYPEAPGGFGRTHLTELSGALLSVIP